MHKTYLIGLLTLGCCGCGGETALIGPAPKWTEYESAEAKFAIKFPNPPNVDVQEQFGRTQVEGGHQGMQCMVIFYEKRMTPEEREAYVEKSQELEGGMGGMKVVSAKVEKRNGHDIVLVTEQGTLPDGMGEQVPHKQMRLFSNANGYNVAVRANGSPDYFDEEVVKEFFDSFQPEALSEKDTKPKQFDELGISFQYPPEYVVDAGEDFGVRSVSVQDENADELAGLSLELDAFGTAAEMLEEHRVDEQETIKVLGADDYVVEDCMRTILGREVPGLRGTAYPNSKNLKQIEETYFLDLGEKKVLRINVVTRSGTRVQTSYVDTILDSLTVEAE